jgi:hypothetical protein
MIEGIPYQNIKKRKRFLLTGNIGDTDPLNRDIDPSEQKMVKEQM